MNYLVCRDTCVHAVAVQSTGHAAASRAVEQQLAAVLCPGNEALVPHTCGHSRACRGAEDEAGLLGVSLAQGLEVLALARDLNVCRQQTT
jgi:hypothetical protein